MHMSGPSKVSTTRLPPLSVSLQRPPPQRHLARRRARKRERRETAGGQDFWWNSACATLTDAERDEGRQVCKHLVYAEEASREPACRVLFSARCSNCVPAPGQKSLRARGGKNKLYNWVACGRARCTLSCKMVHLFATVFNI